MWFLAKWWIPWWLYGFTVVAMHVEVTKRHPHMFLGVTLWLWLIVNICVTIVYVLSRAFRAATRDSSPRR